VIKSRRVENAFRKTDRKYFVLPEYKDYAYVDNALPIACGQTISQPSTVAIMTEALKIQSKDKVLEVGTGSGYQASILGFLCKEVYSIERIPELKKTALKNIQKVHHDMSKFHLFIGDGSKGLKEHAPFNKIIVTAGAPSIPQTLIEQLRVNGSLIIPVGVLSQRMILIKKTKRGILKKDLGGFLFVPLVTNNNS